MKVESNVSARIQYWTSHTLGDISINQTSSFEKVVFSREIPNDITNFEIRFFLNNTAQQNDKLYLTNININVQ